MIGKQVFMFFRIPYHTHNHYREFGSISLVRIADKNEDEAVNFDEFKAAAKDYVGKVFIFLDSDEVNSHRNNQIEKSITLLCWISRLDKLLIKKILNDNHAWSRNPW